MPPKSKDNKDTKSIVPETVDQINLHRYCPKEIFDILFVSEADEHSRDMLNKVIEIGRNYEDISCLTFITYEEVMDLLNKYESVSLPPRLKPTLKDLCVLAAQIMETDTILPSKLLAELMKLKLTEVMYQHYIKEVTKMQKRKKLEEDLNILTKECKKADAGKGKDKGSKSAKDSKSGTTKSGKSGATEAVKVIEDYTAIPIESENDIIFDDDIFNHVWFYAFQGFYDPDVLSELYSNNVPITAVIKVTATSTDETTTTTSSQFLDRSPYYDEYWNNLYKYFDGPKRLVELENTILMRFSSSGDDFKEIFQQLLYVIKNISDIKLQHVNYVRHVKIYEIRDIYNYFPLECLNIYNKQMDKIPLELSSEPVLLNSLLNEVCTRVDAKSTTNILENPSRYSIRSFRKSSDLDCVNPCNINAFFKRKLTDPERIISKKPVQSFLTHELDEINIILNAYKKHGPLVCNHILNLLKLQRPLHALSKYLTDHTEVFHKHDIAPSTKTVPEDEEIAMHIFYLLFFSDFDCREVVVDFDDTELTENLQIYHKVEFVQSAQTNVLEIIQSEEKIHEEVKLNEDIQNYESIRMEEVEEEQSFAAKESTVHDETYVYEQYVQGSAELDGEDETRTFTYSEINDEIERQYPNYYNKPAILYFWKEKMPSDVLLQEVYKAHNNYSYMEQTFSPGTDNLLLQFSDCLDEFGVNTKIYDQSLITPICLRDFCRYVSVEKAEWLDKNKPPKYFRKCEELEICKGVNRINQLQLFQEYSHLLETTTRTENNTEEKATINDDGVTFDELVEELKNYPPSTGVVNECNKPQYEKKFLAYDLGTKYFKIKGGKTVFHSHDGVKISVDNTRFLDEEPKCTVNLSSKDNSLIVHYNRYYLTEDYMFHMNLADGTIITFIVINPELTKLRRKAMINEPNELNYRDEVLYDNVKEEESDIPLEVLEEVKVLSVDKDFFRSLEQRAVTLEEEDVGDEFQLKDAECIFDSLKEAAAANCPIYKVNKNLTQLKRLKSKIEIPLSNILNRILHKKIEKKNFASLTKRYLVKNQKPPKIKGFFDARIAWPNGLYISFYPSAAKNSYIEVKQEFLTKKFENCLVEQEEFRLFTREGYILVKYIDGSIKILKSNGDIIHYEKLDANDEAVKKWRLIPCHCKNINDYRKKLNKIMRKNYEPVPTAPAVSRRAQFRTKKGYVLNPDLVNMLEESKVPYLKSTLLKFNGNRICLENGKVVKKKILHVTDEQDFFAQEIYYERSDGLRSYFDRDGKQQVKFADGTKISSTIHVAKQLADGYVYVSLNFQYEHPNYATVFYIFDNSLEIILNNAVFKRDVKDTMTVNIDDDISTTVTREHIVFQKTCLKCTSKYKCSINIDPFSARKTHSSETVLHAHDSYNKHFCCDFGGNCQRNANFIKGPFNAFYCNHSKKMFYKKMFVVNKNFSGYTFWTDDMVDTKKKIMESDENVVVTDCYDVNSAKVKVIKLRRNVFEQYCNRFLNTCLLKEQMCLAKYKQREVKQLFYTTSRTIKKMTDFEGIKKCLAEIMRYFIHFGVGTRLLDILARLLKEDDCDPEDNMSTKIIIAEEPEPLVCKCVQEKLDMAGKVQRWQRECYKFRQLIRNNVIDSYFTSQFCEVFQANATVISPNDNL